MQYRTLGNTGLQVSVLGFGASPLGDVFRAIDPVEGARSVDLAIDRGINFFDVSPYYGRTLAETRLGNALRGKRDRVILSTKCGRYDVAGFDFSRQRIKTSVEESLTRLRTDYLDLFQAHDIEFGEASQIINETVPALRELQQQGKVRFVGITGLPLRMLKHVAEQAPVDVILSYCRYNLVMDDLDQILTPFVKDWGIGLINASPLHMGVLTGSEPPSWHPAAAVVREAGKKAAQLCQDEGEDLASLAVRFATDYSAAASTLVGMNSSEQVEHNLQALETPVNPELLRELQTVLAPVKNLIWRSGRPENQDQPELEQSEARVAAFA